MSTTREAGDRGEAMAAEYLRENGYEILASQFRCRFGEIDLIARRGDILCRLSLDRLYPSLGASVCRAILLPLPSSGVSAPRRPFT